MNRLSCSGTSFSSPCFYQSFSCVNKSSYHNCSHSTIIFKSTAPKILLRHWKHMGTRGGVVVKALHYKPIGRGFDSRWCHWNFSVT